MPRSAAKPPRAGGPDVILDVIFEDGLFFLAVANIGSQPALDVSVQFAKPLLGLEGAREISALPLFRRITFLAPHKTIRAYLDTSASYFGRRNPAIIEATVSFRDRAGENFASTVRHDMRIYKDLGYVRR
jgi:hypothetical protein